MFKKLRRNKKGFQGVAIAVISTMIILFAAILIITKFVGSVTPDVTWSLTANTTWANVQSYSWTALGLIAIGIIVLGAVAIISVVSKMGGGGV